MSENRRRTLVVSSAQLPARNATNRPAHRASAPSHCVPASMRRTQRRSSRRVTLAGDRPTEEPLIQLTADACAHCGLRSAQEAAVCRVRVDPCSPVSAAPRSPQSRDLRVGPQLPLDIITAGPEDDAGGAPGLELRETCAQLLASACEGHLFGGGHVNERVVAV
jgi:hypothetical protein